MVYLYDTYALIEIFKGSPGYEKFKEENLSTSIMNLYEFYYAIIKEFDEATADYWKNKLDLVLVDITEKDIIDASKFRFKNIKKKLSFINCLGYILALNNHLKFLTGDKEFENMENVEFVK